MTQFAKLSAEAKSIVSNFLDKVRGKSFFAEAHKQLMVSLYSEMQGADQKVLEILSSYKVSLNDYFTSDEVSRLKEEYPAVIGYCFKFCDFRNGGIVDPSKGITYLPESLVELCAAIAKPIPGKSVLLPFAGDGSFSPLCEDAAVIDGFELNNESWAMAQIVLKSVNSKANVTLSDASEFNKTGKKYDYVFTFPPMMPGRNNSVVDVIYDIIANRLNDGGEFYAILPYSFCSESTGWFDVRKILLDRKDYSALVVALPSSMLLPAASVKLCLVHFAKNHKNLVALADASGDEFFARHDVAGLKETVLKVNSVLETIEKQDEKYVWVGTANTDIVLNMQPSRYLITQNLPILTSGEKYVKLDDLIELVSMTKDENLQHKTRQRNAAAHSTTADNMSEQERRRILEEFVELEKNHRLPLVGMKELANNYLNCTVNRATLPLGNKLEYTYLTTNCLLVGFMSGKFKVGKTEGVSEHSPVTLRNEVLPFKVVSSDVTEDYILRCLSESYVEKQAASFATGVAITRLRKEDFLSIVIKVPSTEEQERLCKEDTRISLTESDRLLLESHEEFRRDMHMKKHAIGQTIYNLKNWWKALQKARKEGNGVVSDTAMVGKSQPVSVAEIYDNLQEVITKLQTQINTLDRGNGLVSQNLALTEFIENYISNSANKSPLFTYVYDETGHHASETLKEVDFDEETGTGVETGRIILNEGDPIEYAEFAPEALKIIFDNIVSNATSHGFEGRENAVNYIKFELSSEGDDYVITISNNGNPLHSQISAQDVFTYNKSSKNGKDHFGIGGYEVQKLMREFGGDAQIITDSDSEFPVSYRLIFHNTNI